MAHADTALRQTRRRRHIGVTFLRMMRYGLHSFTRNAWLTVAATVVMTITLLVMFITFSAQHMLSNTATDIGKRIDRAIYLKSDTTSAQADTIMSDLNAMQNVESTKFVSSEEAKKQFAQDNKSDAATIGAIGEATNKLPAKISVVLREVSKTEELVEFVNNNENLKKYIHPERKPSFLSERKVATETIANWTVVAQQFGIVMSVVFAMISILIIFNTIRMAIFNRRDEIQMMKLIGANKSFIRGPFLVEAIMYGIIAALLATGLGFALLFGTKDSLASYGVAVQPVITMLMNNIYWVIAGMLASGAMIGIISAMLATRRYLRI